MESARRFGLRRNSDACTYSRADTGTHAYSDAYSDAHTYSHTDRHAGQACADRLLA